MHHLQSLIHQYKTDPESVFNTWFVNNDERLKAFRSIRRGVSQVVADIREGRFPNDFKGSSLEFVLTCITEQKQVFEGASHPFYWKPKLRIPDIYESIENKRAFGQFLENCLNAKSEKTLLDEIIRLDSRKIKGLGPAVASILYFLHPTLMPPFNTAILNGFNILFHEKRKLGSWSEYLKMREVILEINRKHSAELSNDFGCLAGLLFEIGAQKMATGTDEYLNDTDREKFEKAIEKRRREVLNDHEEEHLHTEMQYHLIKIGTALGYDVFPASNDRSRTHAGQSFSFLCPKPFPQLTIEHDTLKTVKLIDMLWFENGTTNVVAAFEVEKSTSIYSGILRLADLSYSIADGDEVFYIVIPDKREKDVMLQLSRPSVKNNNVEIRYILFSDLRTHCDALCKFGDSHHIMHKIAKKP